MPELELFNTDYSAVRTDQSVSAILTDRQHVNKHWQDTPEITGIHSMASESCQGYKAIWCLPTELLAHIFMHSLPPFDKLSRPSKLQSPMLLTR
ncbi:hypothetical protein DFH29DRAFT_1066781, partial [Suillus ampliporus]